MSSAMLQPLVTKVSSLLQYLDDVGDAVFDHLQSTGIKFGKYPFVAAGFFTVAAAAYFSAHFARAVVKYVCPRALLPTAGVNLRDIQGWAVVTGCTDGQGKQWALELAAMGKDIVLISRNPVKLDATAQEIRAKNPNVTTHIIVADFKEAGRPELFDRIRNELGTRDVGILINNVGQFVDYFQPLLDFPLQETIDQFNVNVNAGLFMTRIVLPHMVERGLGQPSVIVNIASATGYVTPAPLPLFNIYSATKAFVRYLSVALDREYRPRGITVMCVHPFLVRTNMVKGIRRLGLGWSTYLIGLGPAMFIKSTIPTIGIGHETFGHWYFALQNCVSSLIPSWIPSSLWARLAQS